MKAATTSKCNKCDGSGFIYDPVLNIAKKCECYEELIQENRLKFAMIPEEFRGLDVKSFNTTIYTGSNNETAKRAKNIVIGYCKQFEEMKKLGKGLFFYSNARGSGKTRLAVSTGNALMKVYKQRVRFITTLELLGRIKDTYNKNKNNDTEYTEQQLINEFCEIPVLILDDIGTEKETSFVNEIFYRVLDTRMTSKKITIITSNLNIDDLQHDERIKSRIRKSVISVQMPEEDVRGKLGKSENEELISMLLGV